MRSIILRKVAGKLTPVWHSSANPASGGIRTGGVMSFLASPFGLALMTVVLLFATWLLSHATFDPHAAFALGGFGFAGAGITAESNLLTEKRGTLASKAKLWNEADALSQGEGGKRDMSKKELLEKLGAVDANDAKAKIDALYLEINDLNHDVDELTYAEQKSGVASISDRLKQPIRQQLPTSRSGEEPRSFGQLAVDTKGFMESMQEKRLGATIFDFDLKTLLQTSAGWQPRTGNGDRVVDKVIRPVQLLDRIPSDTTDLFEIPFMVETTRTQAAAEVAEAGTYAEDAFVLARSASTVRKIGSQIPVTDEQLADVGSMRSFLDNRLRFGLQARLDQQILVGDGISPNLQGVFTTSGILTQAKAADSTANAVFKAMTAVRITGRAIPDMIVMHGLDWQNVRLAQNAQGDYQFGPPTMVGADTMWGLPVVQSEALTQGNAVVGAFQTYSQLYYKKGIEVQLGFINTQFIQGQVTLRADVRAAFVIYRGPAFAKVTGL
jgi:hypothetical protein